MHFRRYGDWPSHVIALEALYIWGAHLNAYGLENLTPIKVP